MKVNEEVYIKDMLEGIKIEESNRLDELEDELKIPEYKEKTRKKFFIFGKEVVVPDIPFRVLGKGNINSRKMLEAQKKILELQKKEDYQTVPVIHLTDNGDFYLVPAYKSETRLMYKADMEYNKVLDDENKIGIHYFDNYIEGGYFCDKENLSNIKVKSNVPENIIPSLNAVSNIAKKLQIDTIRARMLMPISPEHQKLFGVMFIAGFGVGCLVAFAIGFTLLG